jgi:hypothetical protein
MNQHIREQAIHALEENVENISRQREWTVYEHYEITPDAAGNKYILAPLQWDGRINRVKEYLQPLSRVSADLFLRFAGWAEEFGMDKDLDTARNADAALRWAEKYGALGLNPPDEDVMNMLESRRVTADYLRIPWPGGLYRRPQNSARGGPPDESVWNFAFEAWEAHIVWNLYASVRSKEIVDAPTVRRYMSTFDHGEPLITGGWVVRDIYSQDLELTRLWALTIVDDAVNRKIERYCYPTTQGTPGSYEQGWGFRSLLGAMWLQMMFLMHADRRCWWCGTPLDPGRHSHAKFCDNNGKCRANWNYHKGEGSSSKEARRQARYVR